jgi:hypothetical protein
MVIKQIGVPEALMDEIRLTPQECRPLLLRIIRSFREGVTLPWAVGGSRSMA